MSGAAETSPPNSADTENHRQIKYGGTYNEMEECYDYDTCDSSDGDGEIPDDDGYEGEGDCDCEECIPPPKKYI
ncbi:hypothetical protein VPNG_01483 [Cytospora leucostoma]|uniref:Uncharacterized protein n=1 Tax=Cytospora leucostoma TaxID=1230097 RepID=A0A423XJM3_9PEZI|nr:hypothetical protein VPNG_01483 [Cytospora leucostoma]